MYCTCTTLKLDVENSYLLQHPQSCIHNVPGCAIEHRECHTGNGICIFHHCCKAMLDQREGREGGSDGREIKVISYGIYFQIKQAVVVDTADAGSVKIATPTAACRICLRQCCNE